MTRLTRRLLNLIVLALLCTAIPPPGAAAEAAISPSPTPWGKTLRDITLWSLPADPAAQWGKLPANYAIRTLDVSERRTRIYFGGDREGRKPGEAWVDNADLAASQWPRWARSRWPTVMRAAPALDQPGATLPKGTYVEIIEPSTDRWAHAMFLGDGRTDEPIEGWVDAGDFSAPLVNADTLVGASMDSALLETARPEIWRKVPYLSQLDGTRYADANCGPTVVTMALLAFGVDANQKPIREEAMALQQTPGCDDCGVFIHHLAAIIEGKGVPASGLRDPNGQMRKWSMDDVRRELLAGRLVVPEVRYRLLPRRAASRYGGDHYIVLSGVLGDRFIYNDPADSDGSGYARLIAADVLDRAMANSNAPSAAFAIGR
ncbi:MAG: C39 family peptidase [Chloroflexota bacterium]